MSKPPSDITVPVLLVVMGVLLFVILLLGGAVIRAHGSEVADPVAVTDQDRIASHLAMGLADYKHHPELTVAIKALSGDFGRLTDWQTAGYRNILDHGATRKLAWITAYWTGEPGVGTRTASGKRVSDEVCAMNGIPFGTVVLIDLPRGYEIRVVWDRGSKRNLVRARSRGASTWVDRYVGRKASRAEKNATHIRAIWIAGGQP